jgi:hypothetical protein
MDEMPLEKKYGIILQDDAPPNFGQVMTYLNQHSRTLWFIIVVEYLGRQDLWS